MMEVPLDEVIFFDCITTHPSTGAATDADSTPTFAVYEESTDTDIGIGGNLTKRTSLTGNYRGTFTLSAANGFEVGKWYSIIGSATVNSIAGKAVLKNFRVVAAESIAGTPKADVSALGGVAQSATDLKDFADDGYDPSTNKVQGVVLTDTLTTYTGNTVQTGDSFARIGATGSGLTSLAPSATALSTAQWTNTLATNLGTTNTTVAATLDAAVTTRMATYTQPTGFLAATFGSTVSSHSAADVWTSGTRTLTAGTNIQLPSNGLANVTAWTVAITGNVTGNLSGSVGSVTGSVGSVTGLTASNLDATVSSRSSQTSVDDLPTNAELATALGTADDAVLVQVALVKAKTDLINTATFWLGAFATNSGSTYASAVAGSVVKEIVDNVASGGGGGPTAAEIAEAMFNVDTGLTYAGADANSVVKQIADNAVGSGGAIGPGSVSYTVTIDDGSNPLDGAEVWVSTDSTGTNVVAGTLNTDAMGQVTFLLDAGNYYLWVSHSGYDGTNPTAITVS